MSFPLAGPLDSIRWTLSARIDAGALKKLERSAGETIVRASTPSERRLRILYVSNTMGETSTSYNELALPLRHRHDVAVCSFFKLAVPPPPEIEDFSGDGSLPGFVRALRAALSSRDFQVVHVHAAVAGAVFLAVSLSRGRAMRSTVFTVHSSYRTIKRRNRSLLVPIFATYGRIVFCGRSSAASFPTLFRWLGGRRIRVVPNAVDTERIARVVGARQRVDGSRPFTVLSVGRLIDVKNPVTLLDAFRVAELSGGLRFVGEGPVRDRLDRESRTMCPERTVSTAGLIPRDDVYRELVESDLFVSTSYSEGLPVAPLEAMACACPVVLSDIAPHREIASGADFIPLIPPDDVRGFTKEIERFARMDAARRDEVGEKCKRLVEERFSLSAMHRAYEAIYAEVVSARTRDAKP